MKSEGMFMEKTIGFVGCGNMATAMIQGFIQAGVSGEEIIVSDRSPAKLETTKEKFGIAIGSNTDVAKSVKWLVLAVKPKDVFAALEEIKDTFTEETIVVSLAAGVTIASIEATLPETTKVLRLMPNTAAALNCAVIAAVAGKNIDANDMNEAQRLFSKVGLFVPIDEKKMHGEIGLSGSAIAMFYLMADAMGDAGVKLGFTKTEAIRLAGATMAGAAAMILQADKHPIQLKDEVCSPGGTTIEMVRTLEATGFRNSVIEAVLAAAQKSKDLSDGK
jgi:pyrroline-5-carboxylate reductase